MSRYPGGKNGAGVFQTIINAMPRHRRYVEAFAGSAAVFRHKLPAPAGSILIERDEDQAGQLRQLASPGVTILQGDALQLLASPDLALGDGDFVYLDPPYHPGARRDPAIYRHELDAAAHRHLVGSLLPALTDRRVLWALSGYRHADYDEARARHGWHRLDYQAMTHRGPVIESLWTNYDPAAVQLHDYRHLGRDFRERERIGRKVRRWASKLEKLPQREREAIMVALASHATPGDGIPPSGLAMVDAAATATSGDPAGPIVTSGDPVPIAVRGEGHRRASPQLAGKAC